MRLVLVAPPSEEPVTLAELKEQLGVTTDLDDAMLTRKIAAARQYVERFLGAALLATTYDLLLPGFPPAEIRVPRGPLANVVSLAYRDPAGAEQALGGGVGGYMVVTTTENGFVFPAAPWPATAAAVDAVRLRYVAGADDRAGVDPALKEAVLELAAWWYEQREAATADAAREVPFGVREILAEFRGWTF